MIFSHTHHKNMKSSNSIIKSAFDVLNTEISGIKLVKKTFDSNFVAAIKELSKVKGRVIISGIGKSGHIANKIASTMSSTGTPAQFCHSNEMSHGDLGILTSKDLLIIISNSGNSSELKDAILFSKKNKIKTIGISSNSQSELMQSADYPLLLPMAKEACAVGKAPTTSTTMTLVLGDAICVALMKLKKFKIEDYKKIHPGGSLGISLMKEMNSTKFAMPAKVYEYIGMGLPLLAAPGGELCDFVNSWNIGLAYEKLDTDQIAKEIIALKADFQKYAKFKDQVISCRPKFDRRSQSSDFADLIEKYLNIEGEKKTVLN